MIVYYMKHYDFIWFMSGRMNFIKCTQAIYKLMSSSDSRHCLH